MPKQIIKGFISQIRGVSYKPTDVVDAENGTPIIRANNIQDDGMIYDDLVFVAQQRIKDNQLLKKGDIVICTSSGSKNLVGKATTFSGYKTDMSFGAFCKVVRISSSSVNPDYIRLFFKSKTYREQISASSTGANINNIKTDHIDNLIINIPPVETQNIAVRELSTLIKSISIKKQQLSALNELVKSRFIEMFGTLDLSIQGETWLPLSDVSTIFTGTTPSTKDSENWNGDIPWVTPAELSDDSFVVCDTERKITQKGMKSKSLSLMPKNTVLLSTRAPIGKVAITGIEMCCNQGFKNFYCNNTVLNPIYLYTLLRNNSEYLNSLGTGTTFKEISKKNASNIKVPVADISLQNEFADFVKLIDKSKFVGYFTLNIFYVKSSHFHHPP